MSAMDENTVKVIAQEIANSIIESARMSGNDPIAWVTGNRDFPPIRSFAQAETVFQADENHDGELFDKLIWHIDQTLEMENVALETGPDGSLYAVDLTRFQAVDDDPRIPHATLQEDWEMYNSGTIHN